MAALDPPAKGCNQRDIARALGVSQVAVSLALRGDLSISAALRKRVRAAAKRLGYCPTLTWAR